MLAYILAIAVGLGSLILLLTAFLLPKIHRQDDFLWSGIGFFYALVLWFSSGRITGALLLSQVACVFLIGWLIWENLKFRRVIANPDLIPQLETFSLVGLIQDKLKRKPKVKPAPPQTQETASTSTVTETATETATETDQVVDNTELQATFEEITPDTPIITEAETTPVTAIATEPEIIVTESEVSATIEPETTVVSELEAEISDDFEVAEAQTQDITENIEKAEPIVPEIPISQQEPNKAQPFSFTKFLGNVNPFRKPKPKANPGKTVTTKTDDIASNQPVESITETVIESIVESEVESPETDTFDVKSETVTTETLVVSEITDNIEHQESEKADITSDEPLEVINEEIITPAPESELQSVDVTTIQAETEAETEVETVEAETTEIELVVETSEITETEVITPEIESISEPEIEPVGDVLSENESEVENPESVAPDIAITATEVEIIPESQAESNWDDDENWENADKKDDWEKF